MSCGYRHVYADHASAAAQAGEASPPFAHACPPFPIAALAVAGAFVLSPPLGVAALAYAFWRYRRHGGWSGAGANWGHCRRGGRAGWRGFSTGNSAFDDKRRETLEKLAEEEKAFAEFRRRERAARDKDIYDRFTAESRNVEPGRPDAGL